MSLFRSVQTGLDLNGPNLVFSEQPVGVATSTTGTVVLTGVATAGFTTIGDTANSVVNAGAITYQWYKSGVGSVTDGTYVSGSQSSTLTLTNVSYSAEHEAEYYLEADYDPKSIVGLASTSLGGFKTGNAPNEPLKSRVGLVTVFPTITIASQPSDGSVATGITETFSVHATDSDGGVLDLSYKWQQDGNDLTDATTIVGSATTQLGISTSTIGITTIRCKITHPLANPSPVYTNVVDFEAFAPRNIINYECFSENSTTLNSTGSQILPDGSLSFRADTSAATRSITFYPSEKDVEVKITMGGSRGNTTGPYRRGHGGISVFKITLIKNTEYTIKLGVPQSANLAPQGGNPGGGGSAVLYRKGNVIAVCGGGGGAGDAGRGGDGGGVDLAGESSGTGIGGQQVSTGTLGTVGSYARSTSSANNQSINFSTSNNFGGFLSKCTVGEYYAQQGFSPCQDLGKVQARTYDGDIIIGSAELNRGYKAGFGYRENGGNSISTPNYGGGGAGAYGGKGSIDDFSGGGGGSGYSNGEITLLTSTTLSTGTRQGGNDDTAFITIEATETASDNEPVFPAASSI
tara:strand:+ start:5744 stop:7468 length:1725 start_codon:yes stop_codon:yes gene_type:complete